MQLMSVTWFLKPSGVWIFIHAVYYLLYITYHSFYILLYILRTILATGRCRAFCCHPPSSEPSAPLRRAAKAGGPPVGKPTVPAVRQATVPDVGKPTFPAVRHSTVPAVRKPTVPAVRKPTVPAVRQSTVPAVRRPTVPPVSQQRLVTSIPHSPPAARLQRPGESW